MIKIAACVCKIFTKLGEKSYSKRVISAVLCVCILILSVCAMYYDFSVVSETDISANRLQMPDEIQAQNLESLAENNLDSKYTESANENNSGLENEDNLNPGTDDEQAENSEISVMDSESDNNMGSTESGVSGNNGNQIQEDAGSHVDWDEVTGNPDNTDEENNTSGSENTGSADDKNGNTDVESSETGESESVNPENEDDAFDSNGSEDSGSEVVGNENTEVQDSEENETESENEGQDTESETTQNLGNENTEIGNTESTETGNTEATETETGNTKGDESDLIEPNGTERLDTEDTESLDFGEALEDTEKNDSDKNFVREVITKMNPLELFDFHIDERELRGNAAVACGVISSDTTWTSGTLYDGTLTVEKGVTLTILGQVTIAGNITINGGGTILRNSIVDNYTESCLKVSDKGNLRLCDITLDGASKIYKTSMINVYGGKIVLDNGSVIKNCSKVGFSGGPALILNKASAEFYHTTIENCSSDERGGAVMIQGNSNVVIYGGTYKNNCTTGETSNGRGGGFIYNCNGSTLTVYGGNFIENSTTQRGGCIYHAGGLGVETYVYGGIFRGNTAKWPGFEGSGAIWNSSVEDKETTLVLAGNAQYCGDGIEGSGTDGIYLDQQNKTPRKIWLSDTLSYPIYVYVKPKEGYVIAEGKDYTLLHERDMKKINFVDTSNGEKKWYAVLNKETNQVIISEKDPGYGFFVTYVNNGAEGKTVTDDTEYKSGDFPVVLPADGLTQKDHCFIGWNTRSDGKGIFYQANDTFEITEDISLYAIFEETNLFKVSFYSGENCNKVTEKVKFDDQTNSGVIRMLIPENMDGWNPLGWSLRTDEYTGGIAAEQEMEITADTEFYATYKKDVTITYKKSDSDEVITQQTGLCYANVHQEISYHPADFTIESEWTEKGMRFIEWNTESDGRGESYQPGEIIPIKENITLYAIMEEQDGFYVSYYSGEMCTKQSETVTMDDDKQAVVITQIPEEIPGWTAVGWSTDALSYQPEIGVQDTVSIKDDTEFFAVYEKEIFVSYRIPEEKEEFFSEAKTAYCNVHNEISLSYPEFQIASQIDKKGYHFLGWNTKEEGSGISYEPDSMHEFNSDMVLYAQLIDDIAPVFLDISYNEGHKNLLDWVIRKRSLLITVPLIEEGSGIKNLDYIFLPEQGEQYSGTINYGDIDDDSSEKVDSSEITQMKKDDSNQSDPVGTVIFREDDENIAAEIAVNTDFKGKIVLTCTDNAGNVSLQNTIASNGGVIVENRAPIVSFSSKDGDISALFEKDMILDVLIEDDVDKSGISGGIFLITYQVDDGLPEEIRIEEEILSSYRFEIPVVGDGKHKILVSAVDHAGNETAREIEITIGGMHTYYVEHYQQNLTGDGYTLFERVQETGCIEETVIADAKQYVGFIQNKTNPLNQLSGVIAGDDSLVLKIYYDRILYGVSFDLNGANGNAPLAQAVRYGDFVKEVDDPVRRGYTFKGWYTDVAGTNENYWNFAETVEQNTDQNIVTLYAKWADETAPVLMDTEIESGYTNFFDWIIKKESLTLTVPIIEEGSGADFAEYTLLSESGDTLTAMAELIYEETEIKNSTDSVNTADDCVQSVSAYAVVVIEADLKGSIYLTCSDQAGNISAEKCLVAEDGGVIVEDNAPDIIIKSENGNLAKPFYRNISLDIEVHDDVNEDGITSEIKSITYQIDGTKYQIPDKEFTDGMVDSYYFSVDITDTGDHLFSVTAVDHAGNQNTVQISITILAKEEKIKNHIVTTSTAVQVNDVPVNSLPEEPQTGDSTQTGVSIIIFIIAGFTYLFICFNTEKDLCDSAVTPEARKNKIIGQLLSWAEKGKSVRRMLACAAIFFVLGYYHLAKKWDVRWKGIYEK